MTEPELRRAPTPDLLESLQSGRYNNAVAMSEIQMRNSLGSNPELTPDSFLTRVTDTSHRTDQGILGPMDLLSLEAIGVDLDNFIPKTGQDSGPNDALLASPQVGDEAMEVRRFGRGITVHLSIDGHEPDFNHPRQPAIFTSLIQKRLAASPVYQELGRLRSELDTSRTFPPIISTKPMYPADDPLATAAFLREIEFAQNYDGFVREIREGKTVEDLVGDLLRNQRSSLIQTEETDTAIVHTWGQGAVRRLTVDKPTGTYTYAVSMDPASNYVEKANQAPGVEDVPFVETECAQELCKVLAKAGLMFHPSLQLEMMDTGKADRYGSIYTQLTREVAKWVNDPKRTKLSNLLVPYEPEFHGEQLTARNVRSDAAYEYNDKIDSMYENDDFSPKTVLEQTTRQTWNTITTETSSEAATTLLDLIQSSLTRSLDAEVTSDLPVTRQEIHIRAGACFDAVAYYISAAAGNTGQTRKLQRITEGNVELLEKIDEGAHTFLSTHPLTFNGVKLPRGSLFTRSDDGWAFLRLTPFAFDEPADQLAFGSEIAKARANEGPRHFGSIKKIGGMSLLNLMATAR
jgi:hypothetical protein